MAWLLVASWHMSNQSKATCQRLGNDTETSLQLQSRLLEGGLVLALWQRSA